MPTAKTKFSVPTPNALVHAQSDVRTLTAAVRTVEVIDRIHDEDMLSCARQQQAHIVALGKEVAARKDAIVRPLNTALKEVRTLFAPVEERLATSLNALKAAMTTYDREVQRRLAQRETALAEAVDEGRITEAQAAIRVARTAARLGAGNLPMRTVRRVVIDDPAKVPQRYWVIDEVLVRKDALDGKLIPGVSVVEDRIAVNR